MFALPGLLALIFVDYLRPQEYFAFLRGVPLLHASAALASLGFLIDLRTGITRLRAAPHLVLALLFFAWCFATLLVRAPEQVPMRATGLLVSLAVYLLVAHAIQSFRTLQVLAAFLLAISLALSAFGIHQATAPWGCHRIAMVDGDLLFIHDGRSCDPLDPRQCELESDEPGADYRCERAGLWGTSSIRGRVRYRGTLEDPNELALVIGIALPFAFAFFDRKRSTKRLLVVLASIGAIGLCTFYTQSRGGQLVVLTVLGLYFVKRVGLARGLASGLLLALPILLFGGRSGDAAEASTNERIECWWEGLHMFTSSPGIGVGFGQFVEHHHLTAHNSYVLAVAELGLPGLLLWSSILYLTVKIPYEALRRRLAPVGQSWALALLASICGFLVGIMFLSFAYKVVLWLYVGLSGVLYQAIKKHDPEFTVGFGMRDFGIVALVDAALIAALAGYTGSKLGW
jgi:O-antigen ligase